MKRFFVGLILMLSVFSFTNAHPFKSDKELYDYYSEIDKKYSLKKINQLLEKNIQEN